MKTILRPARLAGLAAVGAVLATMVTGTVASAAEPVAAAPATVECGQYWDADFNTNGVNIRSGPGTGYAVVGAGYIGDKIDICTSTSGTFVDCGGGRRSDWWDEIINRRTGVRGHISQCFVNYER